MCIFNGDVVNKVLLILIDHENAILYRLQDVVLEQADSLLVLMELTSELDW